MDINQQQYQQSNPSSQYYIPPQKKHNFISMILILVILLGAIGLYFAMKDRLTGSNDTTAKELSTTVPLVASEISTKTIDLSTFQKPIHDEIRVYNSDGKEILELYSKDSMNYNGLNLSDVKLTLQIPEKYPEGEYKVKVKFSDDKGKKQEYEETVFEKDEMVISHIAFTDDIDNNYNFKERVNKTFVKGESVVVYAELQDIPQEYVNGKYHYNIAVDVAFFDTDGRIITSISKNDFLANEEFSTELFTVFRIKDQVTPSLDSPSGFYKFEVVFRDVATGKSASKSSNFFLG